MAPQFDRDLRELLRTAGYRLVRQGKGNFAVPLNIPSRHTANAILRQAGLPKAF